MNKGTAIIGFFLCFLAGMGLMYSIDRSKGVAIGPDDAVAVGSADHSDSPIPVTSKDPSWGNPDAPVTIVEISDFQCPFCSRVGPTLKQIKDTYGKDKVRIVWKHNPLPFHKEARPAHEAAATVHAIAGSEAFWKFHDLAFANQRDLKPENFEKWAREAGADAAKFKQAFDAKTHAGKVDEDMALAQRIGASGTPAFRINGVTLSGAQPLDKFKEVIDQQLDEAKKLVASGTKPSEVYTALTRKNAQVSPDQAKRPDQQKPAEQPGEDDKTVWRVPVDKDDPVKGAADALVTIIEWSDYQCPFCKKAIETLDQVEKTYGNDVRVVWKDNALPFHPRAMPAAVLAKEAGAQKGNKGYWDANKALFESNPKLEDADLEAIAKKLGVDWTRVKAAIDGGKYKAEVEADMDLADDVQARGTPHFFVNGRRLSGAVPFEKFKALIDEEIGKARAMVARGIPRAKIYEEIIKEGKSPPPPEKKQIGEPPASSPFKGGKNAKIVIQEFSDYQCPFCKRVEPTISEVMKEFGDKVKVVWRDMPLDFHKDAPLASQAAREAHAQKGNDGFWKFHDKLFEVQGTAPDAIQRPGLEKIAQELGLDMAKFKAALDANKHQALLDADVAEAKKVGISGTPAFTINGYFVSGAQPVTKFKKLIQRAMKEAK
jgi:protein-disulfide isomerase